MANQPRIYCPKCSAAARRIYFQDASDKRSTTNWRTIATWAYCETDDLCFAVDD
ncbi:MAG: hypothetical protein V4510_04855 [bacterium]